MIAGHKRAGNDDSPKIIEETRQYIRDFDRVAGTTTTARGLYDKMLDLYPHRVNPGGALWRGQTVIRPYSNGHGQENRILDSHEAADCNPGCQRGPLGMLPT